MRAFADCHGKDEFERTQHIRNLDFRSSYLHTKKQAIALMRQYCPHYNNFKPDLLIHLPDDCLIRIAREGSPAVYVETESILTKEMADVMKADEFDLHQTIPGGERKVYRFWWD